MSNNLNHLPSNLLPFMAWRWYALALSLVLIVIGLTFLTIRGLNLGMEFTGGDALEYRFETEVNLELLHERLESIGITQAVIANLGSDQDVLIRVPSLTDLQFENVKLAIANADPNNTAELLHYDKIGLQVANDLQDQAVYAVLASLVLLLLYIGFRFQVKFAVGAIAALIHDVLIVVGAFAVMGWEFSLNELAAVLTIVGYSINDTIVIFDRVRENLRRHQKLDPKTIINLSLTQTLERTIVTSLTVLLVVLALFFVGGEVFRGFSLALIIGLIAGTYSTIYIASNIILIMEVSRFDLLTQEERDQLQLKLQEPPTS